MLLNDGMESKYCFPFVSCFISSLYLLLHVLFGYLQLWVNQIFRCSFINSSISVENEWDVHARKEINKQTSMESRKYSIMLQNFMTEKTHIRDATHPYCPTLKLLFLVACYDYSESRLTTKRRYILKKHFANTTWHVHTSS